MKKPNLLYPGLPNYKGSTKGFFTCLWHNTLVAYIDDVDERLAEIRRSKPANEIETRMRYIVWIPAKVLPKKAGEKLREAGEEWENAGEASNQFPVLLKYLKEHVKDCRWNEKKRELIFPKKP